MDMKPYNYYINMNDCGALYLKVRGLRDLEASKDSPDLLMRAIEYMENNYSSHKEAVLNV